MVTCTRLGRSRLGNQMFQYAMLRGIAAKRGFEVALPSGRHISLWKFNLISERRNGKHSACHVYSEKEFSFSFNPIVFEQPDDTDFDGFFQSEKYFKHIESEIRSTFVFSKQDIAEVYANNGLKDNRPLVGVHVRQGDYINHPRFAQLGVGYFQNAMSLFPNATFVVISNGMPWCQQNIKGDQIKFFQGSSPFVDMAAMTICDHNIISNSTFGWWGAWLNPSPSKRVVRPSKWWGPRWPHLEDRDICPDSWEIAPIQM